MSAAPLRALVLALAVCAGLVVIGSAAAAGNVVISQVYGGGGNSGATLKNDFIELYNRSAEDVPLTGWSVQYAASGGSTWQRTPLGGTIKAGGYYLVQQAQGAGGTTNLPPPDATGTIPMSATAGKVVLMSNNTTITSGVLCPSVVNGAVDIVGFGAATTTCFEGAGPTATLSNTTAAIRKDGGATDTDNNAGDFAVGAPTPRNSGETGPTVASTDPAAGATGVSRDANIAITFNEPVTASGTWYAISCTASGPHAASATGGPVTFTLNPETDFASSETCTVTVTGSQVSDQDMLDPPDTMGSNYVFSFQTADVFTCGDPATKIHAIQGTEPASSMVGSSRTIEGVVVGDYQLTPAEFNGFYVQEETGDVDEHASTSEGIFVFGGGVDVNAGDVVRVRGIVSEFGGLTQLSSVNAVVVCPAGGSAAPASVSLPVASTNALEAFEGMLVTFSQTLTATEVFNLGRFGEISLSGVGRLYTPTAVTTPGAAASALAAQNNRSRIILDDGNNQQNIDPTRYPAGGLSASNTLRVGDTLPGLTGVLDFRFSNYRIQPVGPISFTPANPRTSAPAAVGGNLRVASFNVLNYFNGDGAGGGFPTARGATTPAEFARQRAKEISALKAMNADIVGLMEIENDAPPNSAVEDLVAGLNEAMGAGTYAFIDTGVIGTDEIRVALIYKPAAVTPVGAWKAITSAVDPRFIDTRNRPSLAQTFRQDSSGQKLTVVVNHLKSKGSACEGDPDTGDGSGNCNGTRTAAAAALVDWLATDPTESGDPDFLFIGDLNAYTFETPITTFEAGGYTNLVRREHGLSAYSYVFNGESGYLDHALATSSLAGQVTGVTDWHINPDEPTVLDYNTEFKTANQVSTFYDAGPYRSSDHDPVVIGIHFNTPPAANAGGPYSVHEGSSIAVSATGTDVDGDALAYAWDLDGDGTFETSGQTATFSAATIDGPASRTIRVRVSDGTDATVATAQVTVTNVAPTATFNAPASSSAGFPVTLAMSNASDPSAADTNAGFTYAFDCGDGSGYGAFAATATAACPTDATGTRSVGGKIRDRDGGETEHRGTVVLLVTFVSLSTLTQQFADDSATADSLTSKLDAAAAASAAGNGRAKAGMLTAYENEVRAQTGKALTEKEGATLTRLARAL